MFIYCIYTEDGEIILDGENVFFLTVWIKKKRDN